MKAKVTLFSNLCNQYELNGLDFQYFHVCHTRLWMNRQSLISIQKNTYIEKGSAFSYKKEESQGLIMMGLKPDKIDWKQKIIHEHKISQSFIEATISQVMFYVIMINSNYDDYYPWKGKLFFLEQKNGSKLLNMENHIDDMLLILQPVVDIILSNTCPKKEKKSVCERCAYHQYCWR